MTLQVAGIVESGVVRLEVPIDLPNKTPVQITIESTLNDLRTPQEAWEAMQARSRQFPVSSHGVSLSRDELHDRG